MSDDKTRVLCYACTVDFDWHLGADFNGMEIYFDLKSIKHHRKCTEGCGITSFTIDTSTARRVEDENWEHTKSRCITMDEAIEKEYNEIKADYERAKLRLKVYEKRRRKRNNARAGRILSSRGKKPKK